MNAPDDESKDDMDTDTRLALLASFLEPATFSNEQYLFALAEAGGDVRKAAEALLLPRVKSAGKRKAGTSLSSWFTKRRNAAATTPPAQDPSGKPYDRSSQIPDGTDTSRDGWPAPEKAPSSSAEWSKLLRPAAETATARKKNLPQPALLLTNQAAVDKHKLPLSLLGSPLPPSLASALYLLLMEESKQWQPNRFYLAGKWVESPHTVTMYRRKGDDGYTTGQGERYYYSGTELNHPKEYPDLLSRAADIVEEAVNASLAQKDRYPLEWRGRWRANVCGCNRYDGAGSGVGWHADQLTYLGPYCTIASLSLGTPRAFRLRPTEAVDSSFASSTPIRTYEVKLGHNSLVTMDAGCQERFKHTIPPQKALDLFRPAWDLSEQPILPEDQKTYTSRINITFRFYRDDFHPNSSPSGFRGPREGTPICKCGIPTLLRADQKAKARSRLGSATVSPRKQQPNGESKIALTGTVEDDMAFFWQCQSPGATGTMKGCGFFRMLDMATEGRGPCMIDKSETPPAFP